MHELPRIERFCVDCRYVYQPRAGDPVCLRSPHPDGRDSVTKKQMKFMSCGVINNDKRCPKYRRRGIIFGRRAHPPIPF